MEEKITQKNFYLATIGEFQECEKPNRPPDYISGQGFSRSEYWYDDDFLYRCSNHWFQVIFCFWSFLPKTNDVVFLPSENPKFKALNPYRNGKEIRLCGRIRWSDLKWQPAEIVQRAKQKFGL